MSATARQPRTTRAPSRSGYLGSVVVNAVILYLVNVAPGWHILPFLSPATPQVLGLVNASLVATIVANVVYVVFDSRPLRAIGGMVTTAIGLAAVLKIWHVFPFDFTGASYDWTLVARVVLAVAIAGSIIGIVASFATLFRHPPDPAHPRIRSRPA